jgi:hypothetical protein
MLGAKIDRGADVGHRPPVDGNTGRVQDFDRGPAGGETRENAHMGIAIACGRPGAPHLGRGVRERTDHAEPADGVRERQHSALVLQHHNRASADRARKRAALGNGGRGLQLCAAAVGILEETQPLFEGEHAAHGLIDLRQAHEPAFQSTRQAAAIGIGHHVDVHSGVEREGGRLREVRGDAVVDQSANGVVVTDDDSTEAQVPAQPCPKQSGIGSHRNTRKIVEGGHDGGHAGGDRGGKRGQMHLVHRALGDVDGGIVASGGDGTVGAEVLGDRRKSGRGRKSGALEAADLGLREARGQPRILAGPFDAAAPTRIA